MMRIAYVINSLEGGGASAPVPAIAGLLRSQGCDVRILALTGRDVRGLAAIEDAGLPVAVRKGGERDHLAALRWLDTEIAAWQPDLIWTSLTRAPLLGLSCVTGSAGSAPASTPRRMAASRTVRAIGPAVSWR